MFYSSFASSFGLGFYFGLFREMLFYSFFWVGVSTTAFFLLGNEVGDCVGFCRIGLFYLSFKL